MFRVVSPDSWTLVEKGRERRLEDPDVVPQNERDEDSALLVYECIGFASLFQKREDLSLSLVFYASNLANQSSLPSTDDIDPQPFRIFTATQYCLFFLLVSSPFFGSSTLSILIQPSFSSDTDTRTPYISPSRKKIFCTAKLWMEIIWKKDTTRPNVWTNIGPRRVFL